MITDYGKGLEEFLLTGTISYGIVAELVRDSAKRLVSLSLDAFQEHDVAAHKHRPVLNSTCWHSQNICLKLTQHQAGLVSLDLHQVDYQVAKHLITTAASTLEKLNVEHLSGIVIPLFLPPLTSECSQIKRTQP